MSEKLENLKTKSLLSYLQMMKLFIRSSAFFNVIYLTLDVGKEIIDRNQKSKIYVAYFKFFRKFFG